MPNLGAQMVAKPRQAVTVQNVFMYEIGDPPGSRTIQFIGRIGGVFSKVALHGFGKFGQDLWGFGGNV